MKTLNRVILTDSIMENNSSTKADITQFINLTNELNELNVRARLIREERSRVEKKILGFTESNNITNLSIKTDHGNFKFYKVTHSQPLTFKYVESCLKRVLTEDEEVTKMINFLKNSRETSETMVLKKVNK